MKLSREIWLEVEPLLSAALDMGAVERDGWLARVDTTHPQAAPLLRKMLATHDRAEGRRELETISRLALRDPARVREPGEVIGPFVLVSPLGRGGMGEVWVARHGDRHLEREVALKLPSPHALGEVSRERFRRERDILARLEHPHIARLYDAGVTEAGQPWLAMERVTGIALTEAARALPIPGRLALFRQVLSAVALAHRHLVVHRDLKPANILVDQAGQVKLLDFGIAKLLAGESPGAAELTRVGGRVMTLRYAAHEQVAGGDITTATDIYSLGVILHELLTGLSPYRAVRDGKPLTDVGLLREQPGPPSRLDLPGPVRRALSGDLDAIVLKALRAEPAERYASIELLDADIAAFLAKRPVAARRGTWRYLAGRFVLRHKLPLAAAAAVLAAMTVGLVAADRERRVAIAEKARAERHFESVRQLANTFIFDVHGEIEQLAGSLKARQTLVATAVRYLDTLAEESRSDPALAVEIAGAYRRLAEISGDARGAHLGDPGAARRHARRAAELLDGARVARPEDLALLRERRVVGLLLGRLGLEGGDKTGVEDTAFAVRVAEDAARLPGATLADRRDLGATLAEYGGILAVVKDDHEAAAVHSARAIQTLEAVVREQPTDVPARASLAYAYERAAMGAEATGRPDLVPRAVDLHRKSVTTSESIVRDEPLRVFHAQKLASAYNNLARVLLKSGDVDGARARSAAALATIERLAAGDSRNVSYATQRVSALAMSSHVEAVAGRHGEAIELARAAIAADAKLPPEVRANLIVRDSVDGAKRSLAASSCVLASKEPVPAARQAARLQEGRRLLNESRAFKEELVSRGIDARDASAALGEIDAELARCVA